MAHSSVLCHYSSVPDDSGSFSGSLSDSLKKRRERAGAPPAAAADAAATNRRCHGTAKGPVRAVTSSFTVIWLPFDHKCSPERNLLNVSHFKRNCPTHACTTPAAHTAHWPGQ